MSKRLDNFLRINGIIFIALNILIIISYFPKDLGSGYKFYDEYIIYDEYSIKDDDHLVMDNVWDYEYNDRFILVLQKGARHMDTITGALLGDKLPWEIEGMYYWIIDKTEDTIYCNTYYPRFLFLCDSLGTELSLPESPKRLRK